MIILNLITFINYFIIKIIIIKFNFIHYCFYYLQVTSGKSVISSTKFASDATVGQKTVSSVPELRTKSASSVPESGLKSANSVPCLSASDKSSANAFKRPDLKVPFMYQFFGLFILRG